jgi:hypothetical protein
MRSMLDVTTTREAVRTPDGRSLDVYEGHLSLGITRFGDVLDALVESGR